MSQVKFDPCDHPLSRTSVVAKIFELVDIDKKRVSFKTTQDDVSSEDLIKSASFPNLASKYESVALVTNVHVPTQLQTQFIHRAQNIDTHPNAVQRRAELQTPGHWIVSSKGSGTSSTQYTPAGLFLNVICQESRNEPSNPDSSNSSNPSSSSSTPSALVLNPQWNSHVYPPPNEITPDVHSGITCDGCRTSDVKGIRHQCLVCHDFDLCHQCFLVQATPLQHLKSHPMKHIGQDSLGKYDILRDLLESPDPSFSPKNTAASATANKISKLKALKAKRIASRNAYREIREDAPSSLFSFSAATKQPAVKSPTFFGSSGSTSVSTSTSGKGFGYSHSFGSRKTSETSGSGSTGERNLQIGEPEINVLLSKSPFGSSSGGEDFFSDSSIRFEASTFGKKTPGFGKAAFSKLDSFKQPAAGFGFGSRQSSRAGSSSKLPSGRKSPNKIFKTPPNPSSNTNITPQHYKDILAKGSVRFFVESKKQEERQQRKKAEIQRAQLFEKERIVTIAKKLSLILVQKGQELGSPDIFADYIRRLLNPTETLIRQACENIGQDYQTLADSAEKELLSKTPNQKSTESQPEILDADKVKLTKIFLSKIFLSSLNPMDPESMIASMNSHHIPRTGNEVTEEYRKYMEHYTNPKIVAKFAKDPIFSEFPTSPLSDDVPILPHIIFHEPYYASNPQRWIYPAYDAKKTIQKLRSKYGHNFVNLYQEFPEEINSLPQDLLEDLIDCFSKYVFQAQFYPDSNEMPHRDIFVE